MEEKNEAIVEKNNQIKILQDNVTTLVKQLEKSDYQKHSNMLPNLDLTSGKKELNLQKISEKKSTGFIDKHIIRPLRGGRILLFS